MCPVWRCLLDAMTLQNYNIERVGNYVVTPLIKLSDNGFFQAAVSIRRGMHDRVFRFIPDFTSDASAVRYAMDEGRSMVLLNQLG